MFLPLPRGSGALDLDALIARTAPKKQASLRPALDLDALIARTATKRKPMEKARYGLPDLAGWEEEGVASPEVGRWSRGPDVLSLAPAPEGWVVRQTRWRHREAAQEQLPKEQRPPKPTTTQEIVMGRLEDAIEFLRSRARDPMTRPEWHTPARRTSSRRRTETFFTVVREELIPELLGATRAVEDSTAIVVVHGEEDVERVFRRDRKGWHEIGRRPRRGPAARLGSRAIDLDALIAKTAPARPVRSALGGGLRQEAAVVPAVLPQVLTAEGIAQIDPEQRWRFPRAVAAKSIHTADLVKRLAELNAEAERRYDIFVRTMGTPETRLAAFLRLETVLFEAWDLYRVASQMMELHEWVTRARWQRTHGVPQGPGQARMDWFKAHPQARAPERPGWREVQAAGMVYPRFQLGLYRRSLPGPHWFPAGVPNEDAVVLAKWWNHLFGPYLYPDADERAKRPDLAKGRENMRTLVESDEQMASFIGWQLGISGAGGTWFGGESSYKGGKKPAVGISSKRGFRGLDPEKEERVYRTPQLVALARDWLRAELALAKKGSPARAKVDWRFLRDPSFLGGPRTLTLFDQTGAVEAELSVGSPWTPDVFLPHLRGRSFARQVYLLRERRPDGGEDWWAFRPRPFGRWGWTWVPATAVSWTRTLGRASPTYQLRGRGGLGA